MGGSSVQVWVVPVSGLPVPPSRDNSYRVIGAPPLSAGGDHEIVNDDAVALPTFTPIGMPGLPGGLVVEVVDVDVEVDEVDEDVDVAARGIVVVVVTGAIVVRGVVVPGDVVIGGIVVPGGAVVNGGMVVGAVVVTAAVVPGLVV